MSKKPNFSFRQLPPPQFVKIFTISQPQKQLISEHWKNVIASIELQIVVGTKSMCLIYKSNSNISLMCFQEGCLVYQRKFKILHAQIQEITCIKLHSIIIKHKQIRKRQIIVAIGFFDGSIELYHLNINDKSVILKKYLTYDSEKKQAVTSIVIIKGNMYVSRLHQVQFYEHSFSVLADLIIQEEYIHDGKKAAVQIKFQVKNAALRNLGEGMALSIVGGKNALHVFNESEGARTFLLDNLEEYGSVTDSIVCLVEIMNENLVIGDTNDKLKIIYKNRNVIERYYGFKNYCSDVCHLVFQDYQELWIVDLHGCVSYMQRNFNSEAVSEVGSPLKMMDYQIHFATKICEAGIKKAIVTGKMMIVLDTEGNIHLFDIIKKDAKKEEGEVQIESVNQYSSDHS